MGDPGPPGKKVILIKIYGALYVNVICLKDMSLGRNKGWFFNFKIEPVR